MEQDKLKNKLQKRSLSPSSNSWELLDQRLTENEQKKKQGIWIFLKYAASILLLVSLGFYFLKPEKETLVEPIIVEPTTHENFKKVPITLDESETELVQEPKVEVKKHEVLGKKEAFRKAKKEVPKTQVAVIEPAKLKKAQVDLITISKEEIVVAEVPKKENNIDAEVDELLKASKYKISINRQISSKTAVSANALLNEVEEDLDKDFRDKLFESIITTLKTPRKVVITDRGN